MVHNAVQVCSTVCMYVYLFPLPNKEACETNCAEQIDPHIVRAAIYPLAQTDGAWAPYTCQSSRSVPAVFQNTAAATLAFQCDRSRGQTWRLGFASS